MNKILIEKHNEVYAEIYDLENLTLTKTEFFSHCSRPLQFGVLVYEKGHKVKRHKHKNIQRFTSDFCEATFVLDGEQIVEIFDNAGNLIDSHLMRKNHLLIIYNGYHSMDIKTDFKALEFKLGPFIADDKEFAG